MHTKNKPDRKKAIMERKESKDTRLDWFSSFKQKESLFILVLTSLFYDVNHLNENFAVRTMKTN